MSTKSSLLFRFDAVDEDSRKPSFQSSGDSQENAAVTITVSSPPAPGLEAGDQSNPPAGLSELWQLSLSSDLDNSLDNSLELDESLPGTDSPDADVIVTRGESLRRIKLTASKEGDAERGVSVALCPAYTA